MLLAVAPTLYCYSSWSLLYCKALVRAGADCTGDHVDTNKKTLPFCCCYKSRLRKQTDGAWQKGSQCTIKVIRALAGSYRGSIIIGSFCFSPPLKIHFNCPPFGMFPLLVRDGEGCAGTLEGQQKREEMAGAGSNGQDQVTSQGEIRACSSCQDE